MAINLQAFAFLALMTITLFGLAAGWQYELVTRRRETLRTRGHHDSRAHPMSDTDDAKKVARAWGQRIPVRKPLMVAEKTSIRGMITMLENGHPLTDDIRLAIAKLVSAAARAALRTRPPGPSQKEPGQ